jgi:FkbM family methyltransferase
MLNSAVLDVLRPIVRRFRHPDFDEIDLVHSVLRPHGPGVMVDVGAHFGGSLRPFAKDGWRVFAVEPDPHNRAILLRRFARRPNVIVDGRAVSDQDGQTVALYTSRVSTGISALAPFHPSHSATDQVETVRLDTLLAEADEVTFLKTDTEGWDLPVLKTFPWNRLRPLAVICEFEDRKTVPLGYDYHDLAGYLAELGYAIFTSEWYPVVEYGRRHRWRSIRRYPVELVDERAWGNLVAVDPELVDKLQLPRPRRV